MVCNLRAQVTLRGGPLTVTSRVITSLLIRGFLTPLIAGRATLYPLSRENDIKYMVISYRLYINIKYIYICIIHMGHN